MEPNDKLIRQSSALSQTEASSLTLRETVLLSELDLTATNAKTVIEPRIGKEFLRALADLPAEAIEAGFRAWRDESPFFPAISDIRQHALLWLRRHREEQAEEAQARRRQEEAEARERGELIQWPDVLKKFNDIVSRDAAEKLENKAVMAPEVPPNAEIVISDDRREMIRQQIETIRARYQK
jgi:hypothetical protein